MKQNSYILLMDNNYSHEKFAITLENKSCDPDHYAFEDPAFPENMPFGTYDYRLIHCIYEYEVIWRPDLNDTLIRAYTGTGDFRGVLGTYRVADLRPESGMLEYRPDSPFSPVSVLEKDGNVFLYDSSIAENI